jgi:hypothetical protein
MTFAQSVIRLFQPIYAVPPEVSVHTFDDTFRDLRTPRGVGEHSL